MTPDAVVGLLHLADRFGLMVLHLLREAPPPPLPELPVMPGRVHRLPEPTSVEADAAALDAEAQAALAWRELAQEVHDV